MEEIKSNATSALPRKKSKRILIFKNSEESVSVSEKPMLPLALLGKDSDQSTPMNSVNQLGAGTEDGPASMKAAAGVSKVMAKNFEKWNRFADKFTPEIRVLEVEEIPVKEKTPPKSESKKSESMTEKQPSVVKVEEVTADSLAMLIRGFLEKQVCKSCGFPS